MWGRMQPCGGLRGHPVNPPANRLPTCGNAERPIDNRPQVDNLPHIARFVLAKARFTTREESKLGCNLGLLLAHQRYKDILQ
jgi:hypothetical protein